MEGSSLGPRLSLCRLHLVLSSSDSSLHCRLYLSPLPRLLLVLLTLLHAYLVNSSHRQKYPSIIHSVIQLFIQIYSKFIKHLLSADWTSVTMLGSEPHHNCEQRRQCSYPQRPLSFITGKDFKITTITTQLKKY